MKIYYIKKDKIYFNKHLGFDIQSDHWVQDERDAQIYYSKTKAQADIKKYKLKNCVIEDVALEEVK